MTSTIDTTTNQVAEENMCIQRAFNFLIGVPAKHACAAATHEGADGRFCATCVTQEPQLAFFITESDIETVGRLFEGMKKYRVGTKVHAINLCLDHLQSLVTHAEDVMPAGHFPKVINITDHPGCRGEMITLVGLKEYIAIADGHINSLVETAEVVEITDVVEVADSEKLEVVYVVKADNIETFEVEELEEAASDPEDFELIHSSNGEEDKDEWELLDEGSDDGFESN